MRRISNGAEILEAYREEADRDKVCLKFSVSDTGIGMTAGAGCKLVSILQPGGHILLPQVCGAPDSARADGRFDHLPIIAHAMSGDRARSLDAGMSDHITKPINFDTLTETLMRWIPKQAPEQSPAAEENVPLHLPPFNIAAALARTNGKHELLYKIIVGFRNQ